jgi:hypothetical protein
MVLYADLVNLQHSPVLLAIYYFSQVATPVCLVVGSRLLAAPSGWISPRRDLEVFNLSAATLQVGSLDLLKVKLAQFAFGEFVPFGC